MKAFMTYDSHIILIKESSAVGTCAEKSDVLIHLVLSV